MSHNDSGMGSCGVRPPDNKTPFPIHQETCRSLFRQRMTRNDDSMPYMYIHSDHGMYGEADSGVPLRNDELVNLSFPLSLSLSRDTV